MAGGRRGARTTARDRTAPRIRDPHAPIGVWHRRCPFGTPGAV